MIQVVNPDGRVIFETDDRQAAVEFKRSYDAHPSNHGKSIARIIEPERDH